MPRRHVAPQLVGQFGLLSACPAVRTYATPQAGLAIVLDRATRCALLRDGGVGQPDSRFVDLASRLLPDPARFAASGDRRGMAESGGVTQYRPHPRTPLVCPARTPPPRRSSASPTTRARRSCGARPPLRPSSARRCTRPPAIPGRKRGSTSAVAAPPPARGAGPPAGWWGRGAAQARRGGAAPAPAA